VLAALDALGSSPPRPRDKRRIATVAVALGLVAGMTYLSTRPAAVRHAPRPEPLEIPLAAPSVSASPTPDLGASNPAPLPQPSPKVVKVRRKPLRAENPAPSEPRAVSDQPGPNVTGFAPATLETAVAGPARASKRFLNPFSDADAGSRP